MLLCDDNGSSQRLPVKIRHIGNEIILLGNENKIMWLSIKGKKECKV